ncbi:acyltransferase 3 [Formosa agariphila KMM 3901]|uniref:Acyltransferase 3 n=1 Tax=Formosa agariphila (strain DSM 15362 / KCTC 12365 / LMG 23005 / KMM 3901 / M-2Alg 35-1) TaxID=1347342 RepID=T2KJR8_FORAG|nr:acyltransferase family protein [Formosa agariphila]CDF78239.1 acyltransferase 3 [Formosa agariphila KMM 3901]
MIEKLNTLFLKKDSLPKKNGPFLKHFHYFRGFAIINIVFAHLISYSPAPSSLIDSSRTELLNSLREILFHNSTIYFLFVSGFLFYYLSSNFRINAYYKNKLKNVIVPYILISTLLLLIKSFRSFDQFNINEFSIEWFNNIIYGKSQLQFWYIPFISIVFLISPLLLLVPYNIRIKAFPLILLLPLLGTRTGTNITFYQFLYFFPIYIIGMHTAMRYEKLVFFIKKYFTLVIIISITSTIMILLFMIFDWESEYGIFSITEGLFYLQKISFTIIILKYLKSLQYKNLTVLNDFATFSFGIYFTHLILNGVLIKVKLILLELVANYSEVFLAPLIITYSIILIFINLEVLKLIKKIFKKKSRFLVGI